MKKKLLQKVPGLKGLFARWVGYVGCRVGELSRDE